MRTTAAALACILLLAALPARSQKARPPVARKVPRTTSLHGDTWTDDYFWLRERKDPAVRAYLEAENAYADAVLKPTGALRKSLYDEMLGRIQETDLSVPYLKKGFWYYSRTEKGKQYPIFCRRKGSLEAAEEVTLDQNELAKGHPFLDIDEYEVSDDGRRLAYSTDVTGFREYTLHVKDLVTGRTLPDLAEKVSSAAWAADGETLFFVTDDAAKRPWRLFRLALGGSPELVLEEPDESFTLGVSRSRDGAWVLLEASSHTTSEWRLIPAADPKAAPRVLLPREDGHEYDVEPAGDVLYLRTNRGCRNFRVVSVPLGATDLSSAREVLPCREDVMAAGIDAFATHLVVFEREDAVPHLRVVDRASGASHRVGLPDTVRAVFPEANPEYGSRLLRFSYESLVAPRAVYDYDVATRERTLLKETPVLGGYDKGAYASERIRARAPDGTLVPVSIVYRKGMERNGRNPVLMTGYGAYGISMPATFSSNRVSLLDRGVVYAIAHVRGGGDLGKRWHDQGRMMSKWNTFTDFVACAEALVKERITSPERLAIEGGSAGGLLMGAVTNLRPDLFRAVVSRVPFVDVVNTMLDESLPLTVGEFEEWGNPKKREEYLYLRSYSPYENLRKGAYPAILVKTSFEDSQVMYWEPAKYVARLRTLKADGTPLLLETNMAGGHGGSSGRYDRLHETAFDYAFVLWQLGLTK